MMMRYGKYAIIWLCVASVGLSACQPMSEDTSHMTPDERRLHEQVADYNQTIAITCVGGAAVGAAAGSVIGNSDDRLRNMLIGAAIGTVGGCALGKHMADTKENAEQQDIKLDGALDQARKENMQLRNTIAAADKVIATDEQKIARLQSQIAKGQVTRDQAKKDLANVDANIAYLDKTLGQLKDRQKQWDRVSTKAHHSDPHTARQIDSEVKTLNQQVADLERSLKKLIKQRRVSLT